MCFRENDLGPGFNSLGVASNDEEEDMSARSQISRRHEPRFGMNHPLREHSLGWLN